MNSRPPARPPQGAPEDPVLSPALKTVHDTP